VIYAIDSRDRQLFVGQQVDVYIKSHPPKSAEEIAESKEPRPQGAQPAAATAASSE